MTDQRPPGHLRKALQLLHHAVDVPDTPRTPRRRLEGAFHDPSVAALSDDEVQVMELIRSAEKVERDAARGKG